ncbi:zinc-dependent metalloprotease [Mucilaginibacter paludis]|uniref:DUF5117 domain-containing protein n=1 Tax=Mucilaginibacter paludis DSM 18603 TaxID=714943 RepID=H1YBP1_9SPHI|nr:zinc-dependent metalloprotease [Mucilaginibacter paludis]EHQ26004.1 hypothetical protein Mucpa_1852 [Mucilaginibacter paludis DSM 18603]
MQNKRTTAAIIVTAFTLLFNLISSQTTFAQKQKGKNKKTNISPVVKDTTAAFGTVQPYNKVITSDAKIFSGLFKIIKLKDRFYFELPDSLMERDIHIISRITKGAASPYGRSVLSFAGDDLGDAQISFAKAPNNKLFIKQLVYRDKASDTSAYGLHRALMNNNLQPVLSVFDIKTYGKDSSVVIDMTDYLNGDQSIITGKLKENVQVQGIQTDKSYIESVYAYPKNMDIEMVKTYSAQPGAKTLKMSASFMLLPKTPMQIRLADERVGYITRNYNDFDLDPQRAKTINEICRWRLEPRRADMERYIKGELVEPQKPIVFYIDPATPKKWVPYLIRAVNDWQQAFERAGYKNAICAKETTSGDTTWDTRDDRFNTIVYAPSTSFAIKSGTVIDPRSGEIIHANIHVDHNILQELHDVYMVQAGNVDPTARKMMFPDALMGELLRAIVSRNVGYTLGLVNNAGASATVPVEKIKDRNWVRQHGISPSILKDVLVNYTATPEDSFKPAELLPRVGEYDKWAIDWGYRWLPQFKDANEERNYQHERIIDSLKTNNRLFFSPEVKDNQMDARALSQSLGNDPVKAGFYGIQNLKKIVPQLAGWTQDQDVIYSTSTSPLGSIASEVQNEFFTYISNVTAVFGTIYYNPRGTETNAPVYTYVPLSRQKDALSFLNRELFSTEPKWLATQAIQDKGLPPALKNYLFEPGQRCLSASLLDLKVMNNINALSDRYGAEKTISLPVYLNALESIIWPELVSGKPVSEYHMALQRTYINSLGLIIDTKREGSNIGAIALTRGYADALKSKLKGAIMHTPSKQTKAHYQDMLSIVTALVDPKRPAPVQVLGPPKPANSISYYDLQKQDF